MLRHSLRATAILPVVSLALFVAGGCVEVKSGSAPTAPSSGTAAPAPGTGPGTSGGLSIQAFSGAWTSGGSSGTVLPSACTAFDYRVTPSPDGRSGAVVFRATCAGITVDGTGTGVINGDVLSWTAQGTASRNGLACPFLFDNSTAALEGTGVRVTYRGTVCGYPIAGSELLRRP
ncbi:MAG: hypothetical protein MUF60_04635 [Vicinamibacterales bacterium]|jgi:hypothetical protein|nr:hypothetical protein [Vicinamibacterales bacterium]